MARPGEIVRSPWEGGLYGYALNNPVNFVDPTGQCLGLCTALIIIASSAVINGTISAANNGWTLEAFGAGALQGAIIGASVVAGGAAGAYVGGLVGGGLAGAGAGIAAGAAAGGVVGGIGYEATGVGTFGEGFQTGAISGALAGGVSGYFARGAGGGGNPNKPSELNKDWEWKGGEKGQWHNSKTGESLRPDLNHKPPIGPHYDYNIKSINTKGWRVFQDGSVLPKSPQQIWTPINTPRIKNPFFWKK